MFRIQHTLQRNCNLLRKNVSILDLFIKVYIDINKPCKRIDQKLGFISRHSSRFKKDHDSAISGDLYSIFTWYHPSFFPLIFLLVSYKSTVCASRYAWRTSVRVQCVLRCGDVNAVELARVFRSYDLS